MPAFAYQALNSNGENRSGVLDSDTARSVRSLLRAQGLVPLDVQIVQAGQITSGAKGRQKRAFNANGLTIWTRQLAGLVASGLPLERALSSLSEEAETANQRELVAAIRSEVNAGSSMAAALSRHPKEFDATYCAVVGAGEQSGQLGRVLERLADDLEERLSLRAKLLGAALYPMIVSGIALLIVTFLLSYVVPQVAHVFEGSHRTLPLLTRIMLGLGTFMRDQWLWLIAALGVISGSAYAALRNAALRLRFDALFLRMPMLGRLTRGYNTARFASTLAMLSSAGVPILQALQAASETLSNRALRLDAQSALGLVREGAPLASALAQNKRFPPMLSMFAKLGEQTGQLPTMLERAAAQLRNEVQRRSMQLATLLEPLLIVAMGVVVMLIVMAVMLPIIQLNQLVR